MKKLFVTLLTLSMMFFQPVFAEETPTESKSDTEISEASIQPRIIWNFNRTALDSNGLVNATVTIACAETNSYPSGFEILGHDGVSLSVANSSYRSVQLISVNSKTISTNRQSITVHFTYKLRDANGIWTTNINGTVTVSI